MSWLHHHDERSGRAGRTLAVAAMIVLGGVALAGCGDDDAATDTTEDGESSAQEQVSVDIVGIQEAFDPSTATVAADGEVTWVNEDGLVHTTTAEDGTWDSGNLEPGAEFRFTPEEPGTYAYFCSIHPSMKGELVVE